MKNRHQVLMLKKMIGTISTQEDAELETWFVTHPEARKRYEQSLAEWKKRQWNAPDSNSNKQSQHHKTPAPSPKVKEQVSKPAAPRREPTPRVEPTIVPEASTSARADSLQRSGSVAERGRRYSPPPPRPEPQPNTANPVPPSDRVAKEKEKRPVWKRNKVADGVAVALICISSVSLFIGLKDYPELHRSGTSQTTVLLKDSSAITLKPQSAVKVSGHYLKKSRKVYLYGDGYFKVQQHLQPFVVQTSNAELNSSATEFVVNAGKDDRMSEIMVLKGKLKVTPIENRRNSVLLVAGQRGVVNDGGGTIAVTTFDTANALAWKERVLVFKQTPLDEAIPSIEDYFNVQFELKNPDIGNCKLSRTYREPNILEVMASLRRTFGLTVTREPGKIILDGKGCKMTTTISK